MNENQPPNPDPIMLRVGETRYPLRVTLGAWKRFEETSGVKWMQYVTTYAEQPVDHLITLLYESLKGKLNGMDRDTFADLVDVREASRAFMRTVGGDPDSKNAEGAESPSAGASPGQSPESTPDSATESSGT